MSTPPPCAGPCQHRRCIDCRKHAGTQVCRPDRPEPPRPRHAPTVQARNPKRPRGAPPYCLDESALGRSGRCGALYTACIGFKFALQTPISTRCAPAATPSPFPGDVCGSTRKRRPDASFATNATHATQAVKPAFVAHVEWLHGDGVAILHRPPSLGRAPIPPDSSISKSGPRDLDFECPAVAFKIERAKCQLGSPGAGQASMTKGSFRHGFEFCTEWCRPSCSTWKF